MACLWLSATLRKSRFPGGLSKTADFKIFKPGAARNWESREVGEKRMNNPISVLAVLLIFQKYQQMALQ